MEAASLLALAWLIGESALSHSPALHQAVQGVHGLARLCIGMLVPAALLAAAMQSLWPRLGGPTAMLLAAVLSLIISGGLLQWRGHALGLARRERFALFTLLLLPLLAWLGLSWSQAANSAAIDHRLWQALALALACCIGLPGFAALAQRMDDKTVPGLMRPLPARLLAAGVLALALGGLQRQWVGAA